MKLSELKPNPKNPRDIDEKELEINDPFGFGYHIDEYGNVFNLKKNRKKTIINTHRDKDGYLRCALICQTTSFSKMVYVHRIVAMIYCEGYQKSLVVNHKDGIRDNNHYSNLEWITPADNERHARKVLGKRLLGEKASRHKLKTNQVLAIRVMINDGKRLKLISEKYNVSTATISRIKRGVCWNHI